MNLNRNGITRRRIDRAFLIFPAVILMAAASGMSAGTKTKATEVPAKVIAHLPLPEAAGSQMLLQKEGDKQYLYVQKASKQGYTVINVTKPEFPSLVNSTVRSNDDTAGNLELVGPDVGLAEVPDKNSKTVSRNLDNPTETVKLLDLSDPAHPKVLQTFKGVTSILPDGGRGLIYLTNNEGLWILKHNREGFTPSKKKRPCSSADAIASMPPDCE
jgi:hypothetical protein